MELTLEVEPNIGAKYSDCHRHHSLISVPNRNARSIDEFMVPENSQL